MALKKGITKAAVLLISAVLIIIGYFSFGPISTKTGMTNPGLFDVKRSDLTVKVVESGTIKARNAVEIKSEVEGETTIVSVVPEGTIITEQDVKDGKILVELESSEITEKLNQQKITFAKADADYTEAKESYDIQIKQNESDIQQGLLTVKFGLMDLQKYLGSALADSIIKSDTDNTFQIDIPALIKDPNNLGGASLQSYRKLAASIDLAAEELARAENDLTWTEKLYEKEYVAGSELQADQLKVKRLQIDWDQSKTDLDLFIKYEFAKEAEKLFSDYLEAKRELDRIEAKARSNLAQRLASLKSAEATYNLQKERLEKLERQLFACTIKAPAPGMVVYASQNRRWGGSRTSIDVGEEIRQREEIMSLPNAAEMAVEIKVHETSVDKLKPGQKALITIDALPDAVFIGQVLKIAPLPDPQNWMANPDLKVYSTDVSINDGSEIIKPGMSAKVEVVVAQFSDVLSVPVQSVATRGGQKVCYVHEGGTPQPRPVKTGAFNETFVQIVEGLNEGEKVLINPPTLLSDNRQDNTKPKVPVDSAPSDSQPDTQRQQPPQPPANMPRDRDSQLPAGRRPVGDSGGPASTRPQRGPVQR